MTGEWWILYALLSVSLSGNYWLLYKLHRANKIIESLETIIRVHNRRHNANR